MLDTPVAGVRRPCSLALLLVSLFLAVACDSSQPIALVDAPSTALSDSRELPSQLETMSEMARAFSLALADRPMRLGVRDAMRRSPWGQHVLDMADFLHSPFGEEVALIMAKSMGQPVGLLLDSVKGLPPLDLYVPASSMRQSWRGSANVAVFTALDFDEGPVLGYGVGGEVLVYRPNEHDAIFLIGPAARRIERYDVDPGDSIFIEGPHEIATYTSWSDADGNVIREGTYADFVRRGWVTVPGLSSPAMAPIPPENGDTDVTRIGADFCDCDGLCGDLELRLNARFYAETGALVGYGNFYDANHPGPGAGRCHNFVEDKYYFSGNDMLPWALPPGQSHYITVAMVEEDTWPNPDDDIGTDQLTATVTYAEFDSGGDYGDADFDWPTLATAVFDSVYLRPVWAIADDPGVPVTAIAWDQYHFALSGYSTATGWGTSNTSIATASSDGGADGRVTGVSEGSTTYHATVSGKQGEGEVTVTDGGDQAPPFIPDPPVKLIRKKKPPR